MNKQIDLVELVCGLLCALIILSVIVFCFNRANARDNYILSGQYQADTEALYK